jgi:hypothetical protein
MTTSAWGTLFSPISEELTENGFVLRYRPDETDDGLSGDEGTFVIRSFWLVSAFAIIGEIQQAHDLMERPDRLAARPLRRRIRPEDGKASGELPASVLASRADRGDGPHDRPRETRAVLTRHGNSDDRAVATICGGSAVSGPLRRKMDAKQGGRIAQACRGSSTFAVGQERQVTPEGP